MDIKRQSSSVKHITEWVGDVQSDPKSLTGVMMMMMMSTMEMMMMMMMKRRIQFCVNTEGKHQTERSSGNHIRLNVGV